ncbi:MAG: hypothetical protein HY053_08175 [Proteobacteria bacterium]|nr:hypothetical protein [Pseudomonadota bacterium]
MRQEGHITEYSKQGRDDARSFISDGHPMREDPLSSAEPSQDHVNLHKETKKCRPPQIGGTLPPLKPV